MKYAFITCCVLFGLVWIPSFETAKHADRSVTTDATPKDTTESPAERWSRSEGVMADTGNLSLQGMCLYSKAKQLKKKLLIGETTE